MPNTAMMRWSAILIEGLWNVPAGTMFRIHLAENHIVTGTCRWSSDDRMGVEFSSPLALDESGRVAALAARAISSDYDMIVQRKVG